MIPERLQRTELVVLRVLTTAFITIGAASGLVMLSLLADGKYERLGNWLISFLGCSAIGAMFYCAMIGLQILQELRDRAPR